MAKITAKVLPGSGPLLPWPWAAFFCSTGAAAVLGAGAGACLSGGAGQVIAPSLITVRPRMASSSMFTTATPSLALHSSSIKRSRLVAHRGLIGHGQCAVAALLCGHTDDDAAGLHAAHHLGGDQLGRGFAGNEGGGDDDVGVLRLGGIHLALRGLKALAHHFGVTATARAILVVIDFDEGAAQRLDLVGHLGARIVGAHD